jgi:NADH-quinone oxidoreductase subunit A
MMPTSFWPLGLYLLLAILLAGGMVAVSWLLGSRRRDVTVQRPYESGLSPIPGGGSRSAVRFYLMALFFVVFDVQSIFLFAWAISWREVGWTGYVAVLVFVGILMAALIYLWNRGALDWNRR